MSNSKTKLCPQCHNTLDESAFSWYGSVCNGCGAYNEQYNMSLPAPEAPKQENITSDRSNSETHQNNEIVIGKPSPEDWKFMTFWTDKPRVISHLICSQQDAKIDELAFWDKNPTDQERLAEDLPIGISQWRKHGKKYKYWKFFQEQQRQKLKEKIEGMKKRVSYTRQDFENEFLGKTIDKNILEKIIDVAKENAHNRVLEDVLDLIK